MAMASAHFICLLDDLSDPGTFEFSVGEGDWPLRGFVVRHHDCVQAYVNRCPHAGHALNLRPNQFLDRNQQWLLCSSHGALFMPQTGECIAGPCTGRALEKLDIEIRDGRVLLRLSQ